MTAKKVKTELLKIDYKVDLRKWQDNTIKLIDLTVINPYKPAYMQSIAALHTTI